MLNEMNEGNQHYFSSFPDSKVKIFTVSTSLRRHLYIFKTITGVFSYRKLDLGTELLIKNMTIPKNQGTFLDLGCGYGAIGIVLANEINDSVIYLVDINKRAIWCTKENIKINIQDKKKNKLVTLEGDYFIPFQGKALKFDGIYMNPPLRQGRKQFLEVCEKVPSLLKENGFFEFVIKKKMGAEYILNYFRNSIDAGNIYVTRKKSGYWLFHYDQLKTK